MSPGNPRAAKTERIELRADPASAENIALAAEIQHLSVSAFILQAATAEADRVRARTEHAVMPAEQFDNLISSLDRPDEAANLARAVVRRRGPERRGNQWHPEPLGPGHETGDFDCGGAGAQPMADRPGPPGADRRHGPHLRVDRGGMSVVAYYSIAPTRIFRSQPPGKQPARSTRRCGPCRRSAARRAWPVSHWLSSGTPQSKSPVSWPGPSGSGCHWFCHGARPSPPHNRAAEVRRLVRTIQ